MVSAVDLIGQYDLQEGCVVELIPACESDPLRQGVEHGAELAADDATGCVVNALFCEQENTRSYLLLMRDLIRSYGIPLALYSDRHGVFKHTPPSEIAAAPTQFSREMDELGVQLIFARSPQAKGRVERTAGTLQDRLVTELRLAGATTIDDANRVLDDFLPRFNERFRVPPEHAETAYRVLDPGMCLDTVLCLKYRRRVGRDNTVKYRWRTLQLLPDSARPSYAGSVVEVLEGLGGRLAVQHEGRTVASQEAPPRPGILRSFGTRTVHTTVPDRYTNGVIRRSEDEVASMGTMLVVDRLRDDADPNGAARVRRTVTPRSRKPTPLQTARWKAVQKAKRKVPNPTLAPPPTGFTIQVLTNLGVQARWDYLDHAEDYLVEYRPVGTTVWQSTQGKRNWLIVTNLLENTTYEFRLSARGDGNPYLTDWGERTATITAHIPYRLRLDRVEDQTFVVDKHASVAGPVE